MTSDLKILKLQVTEEEAQTLMEILNFSSQAASMLASKELDGNSLSGAAQAMRFSQMAQNAKQFVTIISEHIDIGEPDDGQVH